MARYTSLDSVLIQAHEVHGDVEARAKDGSLSQEGDEQIALLFIAFVGRLLLILDGYSKHQKRCVRELAYGYRHVYWLEHEEAACEPPPKAA